MGTEEFRSLKNTTEKLKSRYEKFPTELIRVKGRLDPFSAKNLVKVILSGRSIFSKAKEIEEGIRGISLQNLSSANHAFFIGQMRHLITHRNGEVDDRFLNHCGINMDTLTLSHGKSPLWDTNIWPTEKEFLFNFKPPENGNHFQFSLAIENVVLPYLHHASKFVDEVFGEFKRNI